MLNDDELGKNLPAGSHHYRAYVGPPENYDLVAANQFNLLTLLGLRENHYLLDIGCGSLRGGRLFIPYILPERYYGIEPNQWLIDEGIANNLGKDVIAIKKPKFSNDRNFTLSIFKTKFDFIVAQSIFSHASQTQIRECLSEAKKVMKPTSIFVATFLKGQENYSEDSWFYPDIIPYTQEFMISKIEEAGLFYSQLEWPHPGPQTWIAITSDKMTKINDPWTSKSKW